VKSLYDRIYDIIRQIPRGRVATYGQIAYLLDPPCDARRVGWALAALCDRPIEPPVPWQRVVNAKGMSSLGSEQLSRLEKEGIEIDARGRIDLDRFGWDGMTLDFPND
jgi:methylated-DNA-protein-cysteine methyltransferase-like protein